VPVSAHAAVALGSNLGDRRAHIDAAFRSLAALPRTRLAAAGPVREYPALSRPGVEPGGPYLNSAALLHTELSPRALLAALHAIERSHGRRRDASAPWSPRTLDLDLLAYDHLVLDEPDLRIPHPRLHERRFVLEPLAAIAPDLRIPPIGRTVADLLNELHADA
jgi:2-amino-4-hydroxy-6-hydroxymethyldihydropteridine diphosphokinase